MGGLLERGGLIKNYFNRQGQNYTTCMSMEFEMFRSFNNDYMCELLHYNIQSCNKHY